MASPLGHGTGRFRRVFIWKGKVSGCGGIESILKVIQAQLKVGAPTGRGNP